jgi:hypothetical protein
MFAVMNRYHFGILISWLALGSLFAQKHDYNWVTGYDYNYPDPSGNMRIDFSYSPPKVFKENLKMNFQSCRGSFSDSSGILLFYTNGIRIFNKNHQLMEGGDTINPGGVWNNSQEYGYVTTYPVAALPLPKADNIYYLFHTDVQNGGSVTLSYAKHFYYTVIDMKANNGLGKVLAKNQVLMEGEIMWPAFVKHGNGRDWWVMGMQRADTKHYLYLLSPQGLTGPYIQDIGPPFVPTEYESESLFSEDGTLFLRHDAKTALRLYDFDRCTGQLSNLRIIPFQEPLHSFYAAFSPDNHFLYLNRPGWVWSLNTQAADLSASYDSVAAWEINVYPTFPWYTAYGLNHLGPDGKIYWSNWTSTQALNVMHHPNLPGDAADCEEEGLILPRWSDLGICQFPNYRLGEWEGSPCDTINFQKPGDGFAATPYEPERFRRDTGYTVLPPIPGARCEGCTERDLEMLNNPMAAIYARMCLEQTGKLPDDWPKEKAERAGLIISLPKRHNPPTHAKDE